MDLPIFPWQVRYHTKECKTKKNEPDVLSHLKNIIRFSIRFVTFYILFQKFKFC